MKSLFPKKLMQWSEPKAMRHWRYEQEKAELSKKPWETARYIFYICAALMAQWLIVYLDPEKDPPPLKYALPLILAFSTFIMWFFPRMHSWFPRFGTVYANSVCATQGNGGYCIKTNKITECTIAPVMTREGALPLLTIHTAKSKAKINIGIPPDKLPEVIATLTSIGITVKHA